MRKRLRFEVSEVNRESQRRGRDSLRCSAARAGRLRSSGPRVHASGDGEASCRRVAWRLGSNPPSVQLAVRHVASLGT